MSNTQQQQQHQQTLMNPSPMSQLHSQQMPALLPTPTQNQIVQHQNNTPIQNIQSQHQPQITPKPIIGNENTILIVRKIPDQLNNPDKMRQHFSKFGQILDIQCQFDQNKDAAFIQFATNQQAFAAYKSPQSVLNNRFIRLYWYSSYLKQQQINPVQQQQQQQQQLKPAQDEPAVKKPAKERLSFNKPNEIHESDLVNPLNKENNLKTSTSASTLIQANNTGSLVKTVYNKNNNEKQSAEKSESTNLDMSELSLKSESTKAVINEAAKLQEENKKKALMLQMEVKKKAKELMEQQIKDQKLLLKKFEQAKTVEEKSQILALVKKLSESIEKEKEILNGKLSTLDKPVKPAPPPPHHLKLNNKRLNNTNFLKTTGGGSPNLNKTYPSPGAAGINKMNPSIAVSPASNPFSFSRVSVDRRPKQLLFTGLENEQEKTNIINLINQIGCQIENTNDQQPLSLTVNFLTRKDAEIVSLYSNLIFFYLVLLF
jgi:hypothetical protein